jgi:AsmA protein
MMKFVKTLLLSITALILLVVISVALAFFFIDPSRYKLAIESVFAEQTGLRLTIAGDINWSFRPVFGLSLMDLRLNNPHSRMELASLSEISIKVQPRALLDGRLEMQEFIANNLHINWIVDSNGTSNWQIPTETRTATPSTSRSAAGTDIAAVIEQIIVNNASLAIQDQQRGLNNTLSHVNFNSSNTNVENRPFPFELNFQIADNDGDQHASMRIASTATIDYAAGNARFDALEFRLNPLQLSGTVAIENFHNSMSWRGQLSSNTFTLSDFLDLYVRAPMDSSLSSGLPGNYNADSDQFNVQIEFSGDAQQLTIPNLTLALDAMRLTVEADYALASPGRPANLRYNLNANALDLNPYTRASEPGAEASATADPASLPQSATAAAQDTPLPIEFLQSMNIQANHHIESLALAGLNFGAINAQVSLQNGLLNVNLRPVAFYDGQFTGVINFDTRQTPPTLTGISSVQGINVAQMAQAIPSAAFAQGRLHMESVYTLRGSTINQMLDTVSGTSSFSLADNAIDVGIVKQVFSSISVLSPAGSLDFAQQWPDTVQFSTFEGHLILAEGLARNQQLRVSMDNFEIAATGGIDLAAERFNYDVLLTLYGEPARQTIPVAPLYQGVGWPVLCNARFDADFSQYCGPDFGKVRDLFVEISRNEVQRRVQDAVTDQVPEELQDRARGLLDSLFR